jgi:hypothetical protein
MNSTSKEIGYVHLDPLKFDPFFRGDLDDAKYLNLCTNPEIPNSDESIKHKLKSYQFIEAVTGYTLIVSLINPETNEEYNFIYPDIQLITMNDNSNIKFQKYYLKCLNKHNSNKFDTYRIMTYK